MSDSSPKNLPENSPKSSPKNETTRSRVPIGAGWGALGGLLVALVIARKLPPLGYYGGDQVVMFAVCIGLGAAIGAGIMRFKKRAGSGH